MCSCVSLEETVNYSVSRNVCFASNGSAEGARGAFGWVSSLSDGTRMLSNSEPARGMQPGGLFRAEGCGQLSWLRFVKHAQMCTQKTWKGEINAWTNNESLVDKASEVLRWQQCAPADMLTSDWDVVKMIVDAIRESEQEGTKANAK